MRRVWTLLIIVIHILGVVQSDGNVGCLLSKKLCRKHEWCFDDFAFGHCLPSNKEAKEHKLYKFSLEKEALTQLEHEFRRLFVAGYRWAHSYTQCIVKNLLNSFRHKVDFEREKCNHKEDDDLARALQFLEAEHQVDPKDLAIIKYQPSLANPHPDYGDELYSPSNVDDVDVVVATTNDDDDDDDSNVGILKEYPAVEDEDFSTVVLKESKRKRWEGATSEYVDVPLNDADLDTLRALVVSYVEQHPQGFPSDVVIPTETEDQDDRVWSFYKPGKTLMPFDASELYDDDDDKENGIFIDDGEVAKKADRVLPYSPSLLLDPTVAFERPHRYDVKKPGPYYKVNNYVFQKEEREQAMNDNYKIGEPRIFKHHSFLEDMAPPSEVSTFHHQQMDVDPLMTMVAEAMPGRSYNGVDEDNESIPDNDDIMNLKNESEALTSKRTDGLYADVDEDLLDVVSSDVVQLPPNDENSLDESDANMNDNFYPNYMLPVEDYPIDDPSGYRFESDDPYYQLAVMEAMQENRANERSVQERKDRQRNKFRSFANVEVNNDPWHDVVDEASVERSTVKGDHPKEEPVAAAKKTEDEEPTVDPEQFDVVDSSYVYIVVDKGFKNPKEGQRFVTSLQKLLKLPPSTFSNVLQDHNKVIFKVKSTEVNGSVVASKAELLKDQVLQKTGQLITSAGIGDKAQLSVEVLQNDNRMFIVTFVVCGVIAGAVIAVGALYVVRRHNRSRQKLQGLTQLETEASQDYQDLCRQRMASKTSEKPEPIHVGQRVSSLSRESETSTKSPSSRSSTSSWNEEPVVSNMDISTGHMVLSYMEDHLTNKDRLEQEWIALCAYEADPAATDVALGHDNLKKNRYENVLPYDHSRVVLNDLTNIAGSDYINASTITDHDPRNPAYIATQGPLPHTSADFWQMIWEQGSVVIVMLTRLVENGVAMCHRYWPEEGSELYHIYEVHLVSEHIWCEDYLVRSFYLKNLKTGETRTVTQFHFLSWPDNGVPNATRALLDFRRKVNKSYRGRSCPIVVHCSDGIGRSGTYCLIDMVLNRMAKGAKEIDIAATLEHIRDQRGGMVRTKAQFEFALMAVAEEVHAILKALPQ